MKRYDVPFGVAYEQVDGELVKWEDVRPFVLLVMDLAIIGDRADLCDNLSDRAWQLILVNNKREGN